MTSIYRLMALALSATALAACGSSGTNPENAPGGPLAKEESWSAVSGLRNDCQSGARYSVHGPGSMTFGVDAQYRQPFGFWEWDRPAFTLFDLSVFDQPVIRSGNADGKVAEACKDILATLSVYEKKDGGLTRFVSANIGPFESSGVFASTPEAFASAPERTSATVTGRAAKLELNPATVRGQASDLGPTILSVPVTFECQKPFSFKKNLWHYVNDDPFPGSPFCRKDPKGGANCDEYVLDIEGASCTFVSESTSIKTESGATRKVTLGGRFVGEGSGFKDNENRSFIGLYLTTIQID